jgi:hypothetical protein
MGPGEVAGFFAGLKHGFEEIGVEAEHFLLFPSSFGYVAQDHYLAGPYARAQRVWFHGPRLLRPLGHAYALFLRLLIVLEAIRRYDVFIFPGLGSFFRFYELPLLKLLGKKVIVIFFGSDARPPFFSGRHVDDDGQAADPARTFTEAKAMLRRIRRVERHADWIVNHTGTDQFFTRDYIRFAAMGLPVRPPKPTAGAGDGGAIRVVHAPSRPIAKGTPIFRRAVEEIKAEGHPIDYIELRGVPNTQVLAELADCDFVLDELYSDLPMAMFATEAATFGKPAVVGSYYADDYDRDNPGLERPPTLFIHPDETKAAVRRLVEDEAYRLELGGRARDFVRRHWSPAAIASRLVNIVEGRVPEEWIARPRDSLYIWGWGLPEPFWHRQVADYVAHNGWDALLLGHRPALVEKIRAVLDDRP